MPPRKKQNRSGTAGMRITRSTVRLLKAKQEEEDADARQRLALSPTIHTLPVELLSLIFCFVADASYGPAANVPARERRNIEPKWLGLPIIAVCLRWRTVASNCPAFWSKIPLTSLEWTKVALERSKNASIVIDNRDMRLWMFPQPLEIQAEALRLALLHASRARQIRICMRENAMPLAAWSILCQAVAPRLEIFHFDNHYDGLSDPADMLFGNQDFPALRNVDIARLCVNHTSPLFQAPLVRLSISNCGPVWESISGVAETLSRMPYLEELTIEGSLPSAPGFPQRRQSTPVQLARLANITLAGSCIEVAAALQSMALRSTCSPSLTVTIGHDEPIDALAILKAELSALICPGGASGGSFDDFSIRDCGNYPALRLVASKKAAKRSFRQKLKLIIHWAEQTTLPMRVAQLRASQCPIPHISCVTSFSATPNILPWRKALTRLLSEMPDVIHLHITDTPRGHGELVLPTAPQLQSPSTLNLDGKQPELAPASGHLFPRCRFVSLHRIDFAEPLYSGTTSFMDTLVDEFAQVDGGPLRDECTVKIADCTLSQGALDNVRSIFGKVQWDGALDGLGASKKRVQERIARRERGGSLLLNASS